MNAIWSPDQKYIVTAVAGPVMDGKATGRLVFLKREGLTIAHEVAYDSCVVNVQWHSKINQVTCILLDLPQRCLGSLKTNEFADRSLPPMQTVLYTYSIHRSPRPTELFSFIVNGTVGRSRSRTSPRLSRRVRLSPQATSPLWDSVYRVSVSVKRRGWTRESRCGRSYLCPDRGEVDV